MAQAVWYQGLRISVALLGTAAIIEQIIASWDRPGFKVANFFSFFTIESNLLAIVMLLLGTQIGWLGSDRTPAWEYVRGATVAYMVTTGVVYAALLAGLPDDLDLTEPWVNVVLHQVMPVAIVVDWVLAPPGHRLTVRRALAWILFPLAFCGYSLLRGAAVDWYPYPFLDPQQRGGYGGVAATMVGIGGLFVAIVCFVVTVGQWARRWWTMRDVG